MKPPAQNPDSCKEITGPLQHLFPPPLPPHQWMQCIGSETVENFYKVGELWFFLITPYLKPSNTFLDLGCGVGRLARFFLKHPFITHYCGVDANKDYVDWCNRFLVPYGEQKFSFHHIDVASSAYNPEGKVDPLTVKLPLEDNSVDILIAKSLFTHLLEPHAQHYLDEIRRVLTREGLAFVSILTDTIDPIPYMGTEERTDIHPDYFKKMLQRSGLIAKQEIPAFGGQDVFIIAPI
jgi:SAM-dependent methyltransferase